MTEIVTYLVTSIIGVWLGSVEWRQRNMDQRLRQAPDRHEVNRQIDLKLEPTKVLQQELKEDLKEINRKMDRLIDMHLPHKD